MGLMVSLLLNVFKPSVVSLTVDSKIAKNRGNSARLGKLGKRSGIHASFSIKASVLPIPLALPPLVRKLASSVGNRTPMHKRPNLTHRPVTFEGGHTHVGLFATTGHVPELYDHTEWC
jgi:hypothetical protein